MMSNNHKPFKALLNIINIILVLIMLGACNAASNGVGGTGITQGRVTGFGSIFVNGIKFNTDNAIFTRDGIGSKTQEDFSTGEIVTVKGTIDPNKTTGTATEVIFSDALEGIVTVKASGNNIEVLGQNVLTDNLTVFIGFNKLSDLVIGNVVEVSGFAVNNGLTASSIRLISENYTSGSTQEVEGFIESLNTLTQTFKLDNLTINYSSAQFENIVEANLENNQYLIVCTEQEITNNLLNASKITLPNDGLEEGVFYEIEGFITKFNSQNSFEIDGDPILTNEQTRFTNGSAADLLLDKHLIVIGLVNNQNVLVAEEIKILDNSSTITIEATIESININANSLVVLEQTIQVDNFTLLSDETTEEFLLLNLANFAVGDSVFISAGSNQSALTAERLSKIAPIETILLEGQIESVDVNLKTISLAGNNIKVDGNTFYFDLNFNLITEATFFSSLQENKTQIQVIGNTSNELEILAKDLFIIKQ